MTMTMHSPSEFADFEAQDFDTQHVDDWRVDQAIAGGDSEAVRSLLDEVRVKIQSIEAQISAYTQEKREAPPSAERRNWYVRAKIALQFAMNHNKRLQEFLKAQRIAEHAARSRPKMSEKRARQIARTAMAYRFRFMECQDGEVGEVEMLRAQLFTLIDEFRAEELTSAEEEKSSAEEEKSSAEEEKSSAEEAEADE